MPVILSERYITQEKNRENAIVTGTYKIAFHHRKTKLFKMCDFGWKKKSEPAMYWGRISSHGTSPSSGMCRRKYILTTQFSSLWENTGGINKYNEKRAHLLWDDDESHWTQSDWKSWNKYVPFKETQCCVTIEEKWSNPFSTTCCEFRGL